jgi:hypothetical protein
MLANCLDGEADAANWRIDDVLCGQDEHDSK